MKPVSIETTNISRRVGAVVLGFCTSWGRWPENLSLQQGHAELRGLPLIGGNNGKSGIQRGTNLGRYLTRVFVRERLCDHV